MLRNGVAVVPFALAAMALACVSIPALVTVASDGGTDATIEAGIDGHTDAAVDSSVDAVLDGPLAIDAGDGNTCPGTYAQAVENLTGLVAYWRLDEDAGTIAHDQTGKHDGIYETGVLLGSPGLLQGDPDKAIYVDGGVGGYVDVPTEDGGLDLSMFTLGALLRPTAIGDAGQQIVARTLSYWLQLLPPQNSGGSPGLEIGFITPSGLDRHEPIYTGALGVGVTSHVVGTYDGTAFVLYVDGTQYGPFPLEGGVDFPTTNLQIGSWDGTSFMQVGVLDEVFVYDRALSGGEVHRLYEAAQGCAYAIDP
jgi:hypothetical protein